MWTLPHKSSPPVSVLAVHNPQAEEVASPSAPTRVTKLPPLLFVEVTHFVPHGLYVWQFQTDTTCKASNNVSFNILHFVKWDSFVYVAICQQNHVQGLFHYLQAALSHKWPHILECGNYENRMDLLLRWCIVKPITMTCKLTETKVKEFPCSAIHFTPFSHQCRKQTKKHTETNRQKPSNEVISLTKTSSSQVSVRYTPIHRSGTRQHIDPCTQTTQLRL